MLNIYLAGGCSNESDYGRTWRTKAEHAFVCTHVNAINPTEFDVINEKQFYHFLISQLQKSDLVLVNLDRSKLSPGTCMELQYASDHNIPIVGFGHEEVYDWASLLCHCIFNSLEDAVRYIHHYYL